MTADTVGGVWTYALELAGVLSKQGVEVALATMGAQLTPQQWEAAKQIAGLKVFESYFKLEWMEDPWDDVQQAGQWLLNLEERFQPDVVHLNGYTHGALPWKSPILVVGHSCVLSWWEAVKGEAVPSNWQRYQHEVAQGLAASDLVVAPSAAMLAALKIHYGSSFQGRVIPNGRDSTLFSPSEKKEFVFTAGRLWDEAKNVAVLEQIAPQLIWSTYVAGDQKHPDGREGSINRLSKSNIHWMGHLNSQELAVWYGEASIYALPARYEPFGLSVLEAALSGCALVLGDIPSLREIWGDAAVFVPPDERDSVASAINALIADSPRRYQLATRARTRALEYTSEAMASKYLTAYQELIHKRELMSLECSANS
jgi:glycosyltransferase involved in cell wall biosynthesis